MVDITPQFEKLRPRLRSIAYSVLGSLSDADDAVQEAWLRLTRTDAAAIENAEAWLTTVVGRISIDMLRSRRSRRERYVGTWLPEPLIEEPAEHGPEEQAVMTDAVSLALLVVLEELGPAERLAFVLHDVFAVSFDEIARIMDRTTDSVRQLASRARRRVRGVPQPDADIQSQRRVVHAFLDAARNGDFRALIEVLDPDVVMRFDVGPDNPLARPPLEGAEAVAEHTLSTAPTYISHIEDVMVNGAPGARFGKPDHPIAVLGFTVAKGKIVALDLIADRNKLRRS